MRFSIRRWSLPGPGRALAQQATRLFAREGAHVFASDINSASR